MAKNYQVINKSGIIPPSQPSEVHDRQVQSLLNLISTLIDHITDPKPLGVTFDSVSENLNYFKSKLSQESSDAVKDSLTSLTEKIICQRCKSATSICKLNCDHKFCENCIDQMLTSTHELYCSLCNQNFLPIEVSEDFSIRYNRRLNTSVNQVCIDCNRKADANTKCRHYCGECLSLKYHLCNLECPECQSAIEFPEELFEKRTLCAGCENWVYVLGDFTKTICKQHTHCLICLKEAGKHKKCMACDTKLNELSQASIRKVISAQCSVCKEDKGIELFVPKQCCKDLVCVSCQNNEAKCQVCNNFLDYRSLSIVYSFSIR